MRLQRGNHGNAAGLRLGSGAKLQQNWVWLAALALFRNRFDRLLGNADRARTAHSGVDRVLAGGQGGRLFPCNLHSFPKVRLQLYLMGPVALIGDARVLFRENVIAIRHADTSANCDRARSLVELELPDDFAHPKLPASIAVSHTAIFMQDEIYSRWFELAQYRLRIGFNFPSISRRWS
jgi:hypothetical protein